MGLVICPKHGNGFMFVCPHVVDAVYFDKPCRGIEPLTYSSSDSGLTGIELKGWFCPQCIRDYKLPPDGAAVDDTDDFLNRTSTIYRPMCPGCLAEWQTRWNE